MEYVDIRGVWPVYVRDLKAYELNGVKRDVPVNIARQMVEAREKFGDYLAVEIQSES